VAMLPLVWLFPTRAPKSRVVCSPSRSIMRHFFANIVGESFRNEDGSDRQAIIPRCRVGELLTLEHEPDNPHDINAIRVLRQTGEQIGYLERDFAGEVVSRTVKGWGFHALVAGIGRARGTGPYGVALLVVVEDEGASDDQVATYGRSVLAKDRDAAAPPATVQPRRLASAPVAERSGSRDRLVVIAVTVVIGVAVAVALLVLSR
jgi:hypothetical protein